MIRLNIFKNLSMTLLTVLIAACLFFIQGEVSIVFSAGVSIDFSGLSVQGIQTSTQVCGCSGTQTAPTVPSSSGIQNSTPSVKSVTSIPVTSSANTPTSTQTTLSTSTSTISSAYTSQSPITYNTPERTLELLHPVNLNNPLSENEQLLPMAEPYAVTVCLSYNDVSVSGCADKKTPSQASEKLAAMILNKYLKGVEVRHFRVVMQPSVPSDQQIQLLRQIETDTIAIIESRMLKEGSQQKQNIIIGDAKIARQEAQSGINWSHNMKDDKSSHDFHTGKAFSQLNNILISGR